MTERPDEDAAPASSFLLEYITAHWNWEIWAFRTWLADGDEPNARTDAQIQDAYDHLFKTFWSERVIGQHLRAAYGDPPDPNPHTTTITYVRTEGPRTVVGTSEQPDIDLAPAEYEYILERDGDRFVLDQRRRKDHRGRWVSI